MCAPPFLKQKGTVYTTRGKRLLKGVQDAWLPWSGAGNVMSTLSGRWS